MSIRITDDMMTSSLTPHTAARGDDGWAVSWLPGRAVTRNQAVTAMSLAEAAPFLASGGARMWPFVNGWAAELGLAGQEAATLARTVPDGAR